MPKKKKGVTAEGTPSIDGSETNVELKDAEKVAPVVGKSIAELTYADMPESVKEAISKVLESPLPIHTAFSMYRKGPGWVVCEYKIQGNRVVEALETIEDLKFITVDKLKIAVAKKLFHSGDNS